MAKLTLDDLASLANETSAVNTINANHTLIETALENTLSRDGTSPNGMTANIDMNSNKLINLDDATANQDAVTFSQLKAYTGQTLDDWALTGTLTVDTINEYTADAGVTIEGITFDTGTILDDLTIAATLSVNYLDFSTSNPTILGNDANGLLKIGASTTTDLGSNLTMYGESHPTNAGDIQFRQGTGETLRYDTSATTWDFSTSDITTTGNTGLGRAARAGQSLSVEENMMISKDGNAILYIRASGDSNAIPYVLTQRSRGSDASPTAVQTNDHLFQIEARGYDSSTYATKGGDIIIRAAENWSGTNKGTYMVFRTTANGATSNTDTLILNNDGGIYTAGATGGSQGADTINASNFYKDGVAFSTGTGDLLASNNLSDVGDIPTARANLSCQGALAALDTVNTAQIDNVAVSTAKIALLAVDTAQLAANAVTNAKMAANAVDTTEIVDNAVSLAKIASGTAHDMLVWNASGDPAALAVGAEGDVLTVNSGTPTWVTPASSTLTNLGPGSTLTIATGVITVTDSYHLVDTEGAAASDDLVTINGGEDGDLLVLQALNGARTVSVKGSGNINLNSGSGDFDLNNTGDTITLIYNDTVSSWCEITRSNNGA